MKIIESQWQSIDRSGPRPASRADLLTVLSNVQSVLIRATLSEGVRETSISDVSLDTAVSEDRGDAATAVEKCRCPSGYRGTSCEVRNPIYFYFLIYSIALLLHNLADGHGKSILHPICVLVSNIITSSMYSLATTCSTTITMTGLPECVVPANRAHAVQMPNRVSCHIVAYKCSAIANPDIMASSAPNQVRTESTAKSFLNFACHAFINESHCTLFHAVIDI